MRTTSESTAPQKTVAFTCPLTVRRKLPGGFFCGRVSFMRAPVSVLFNPGQARKENGAGLRPAPLSVLLLSRPGLSSWPGTTASRAPAAVPVQASDREIELAARHPQASEVHGLVLGQSERVARISMSEAVSYPRVCGRLHDSGGVAPGHSGGQGRAIREPIREPIR
jgi:hypothetical protein